MIVRCDIPPWQWNNVFFLKIRDGGGNWTKMRNYQLHCKRIQPVLSFSTSSFSFRVKFSICCSFPHQEEGNPPPAPPPLFLRMETFTHLHQSWKMRQWMPVRLDYVFFSIVSSLISGFYPFFLSSLRLLCGLLLSAMDAEEAAEWEELLVLPLWGSFSPPVSLHPPSLVHAPSLLLSAPPHLFLSSLLLSFLPHRQICTSPAPTLDNYCCAISSHVRQKGSPPRLLRETNKAW